MRPQRLISYLLWLFIMGLLTYISKKILYSIRFPEDTTNNNYLTISRDVKEFKADQTPLRMSLLDKLLAQFVHGRNFDPDPDGDPIPLVRKHVNQSNGKDLNFLSWFNQNPLLMNGSDLLKLVHKINAQQEIINKDLYPYPEYVIVIQIHNRLEYLTLLINCLLNVKDIHKALLVFSHDMYFPEFNNLIQSIKFAPLVQIFFPFNQQIFSSQFPGLSSKDCSVKFKKNSPESRGCFNSNWSDTYGNYRNHQYTQTKHHWTWKANFVFEKLNYLQKYQNYVVFMEEDHYLAEDFLHVLKLMIKEKKMKYDNVSILCLGTYEKSYAFEMIPKLQVGDWISSFHNMGMTFDRSMWLKMKGCSKEFCEFDDYNWDWSLQHVSKRCAKSIFQVMLLKNAPRIFHIGECGIHHKKKVCNPYVILYKIQKMISQNVQFLYPSEFSFIGPITFRAKEFKPNGGWSDRRDVNLCKVIFTNSRSFDNVTSLESFDPERSVLESVLL